MVLRLNRNGKKCVRVHTTYLRIGIRTGLELALETKLADAHYAPISPLLPSTQFQKKGTQFQFFFDSLGPIGQCTNAHYKTVWSAQPISLLGNLLKK